MRRLLLAALAGMACAVPLAGQVPQRGLNVLYYAERAGAGIEAQAIVGWRVKMISQVGNAALVFTIQRPPPLADTTLTFSPAGGGGGGGGVDGVVLTATLVGQVITMTRSNSLPNLTIDLGGFTTVAEVGAEITTRLAGAGFATEAFVTNTIDPWARNGNPTPIPASKLDNAPGVRRAELADSATAIRADFPAGGTGGITEALARAIAGDSTRTIVENWAEVNNGLGIPVGKITTATVGQCLERTLSGITGRACAAGGGGGLSTAQVNALIVSGVPTIANPLITDSLTSRIGATVPALVSDSLSSGVAPRVRSELTGLTVSAPAAVNSAVRFPFTQGGNVRAITGDILTTLLAHFRGNWLDQAYPAGSFVLRSGGLWQNTVAVGAGTSAPGFSVNSPWRRLDLGAVWRGIVTQSDQYVAGQFAVAGGELYAVTGNAVLSPAQFATSANTQLLSAIKVNDGTNQNRLAREIRFDTLGFTVANSTETALIGQNTVEDDRVTGYPHIEPDYPGQLIVLNDGRLFSASREEITHTTPAGWTASMVSTVLEDGQTGAWGLYRGAVRNVSGGTVPDAGDFAFDSRLNLWGIRASGITRYRVWREIQANLVSDFQNRFGGIPTDFVPISGEPSILLKSPYIAFASDAEAALAASELRLSSYASQSFIWFVGAHDDAPNWTLRLAPRGAFMAGVSTVREIPHWTPDNVVARSFTRGDTLFQITSQGDSIVTNLESVAHLARQFVPYEYALDVAATAFDASTTETYAGNVFRADAPVSIHDARVRVSPRSTGGTVFQALICTVVTISGQRHCRDRVALNIFGGASWDTEPTNNHGPYVLRLSFLDTHGTPSTPNRTAYHVDEGEEFAIIVRAFVGSGVGIYEQAGRVESQDANGRPIPGDAISQVAKIGLTTTSALVDGTVLAIETARSAYTEMSYSTPESGFLVVEDEGVPEYAGVPRIDFAGLNVDVSIVTDTDSVRTPTVTVYGPRIPAIAAGNADQVLTVNTAGTAVVWAAGGMGGGGGTTVTANPASPATAILDSVQVGTTVYRTRGTDIIKYVLSPLAAATSYSLEAGAIFKTADAGGTAQEGVFMAIKPASGTGAFLRADNITVRRLDNSPRPIYRGAYDAASAYLTGDEIHENGVFFKADSTIAAGEGAPTIAAPGHWTQLTEVAGGGGGGIDLGSMTQFLDGNSISNTDRFLVYDVSASANRYMTWTGFRSLELDTYDEGSGLTNFTSEMNFTGGGVTATRSGGRVTVNVPGGGGGGGDPFTGVTAFTAGLDATDLFLYRDISTSTNHSLTVTRMADQWIAEAQDEGTRVLQFVSDWNFTGDGVTVTASGATATVNIPGGGGGGGSTGPMLLGSDTTTQWSISGTPGAWFVTDIDLPTENGVLLDVVLFGEQDDIAFSVSESILSDHLNTMTALSDGSPGNARDLNATVSNGVMSAFNGYVIPARQNRGMIIGRTDANHLAIIPQASDAHEIIYVYVYRRN